jgi:hypothetical protein
MGFNAGCAITSANNNTLIGAYSGNFITTGGVNAALGYQAGYNWITAAGNTAVGERALCAQTANFYNTAVGNLAMSGTTGGFNLALGAFAGCSMTTGAGNIVIGTLTSSNSCAPVCTITTQNNLISMGSTSVTGAFIQVAWTAVSDARDKTCVTALPLGLDFAKQLNPVSYQFKETRESDTPHGPVRYGFLAQEVLTVEGENPVIVNDDDPEKLKLTVDYIVPVLVNAIKELSAKNEELEARLAALENK